MTTGVRDLLLKADFWFRDKAINLLLDLLCWVLPRDRRYQLTIEPDEDDFVVARVEELPR